VSCVRWFSSRSLQFAIRDSGSPIILNFNFNRITQSPLPGIFDLLRVPFVSTPEMNTLAAAWIRPGDISFWFSRSAWSLAVVAGWRQRLSGSAALTIWLPDFFCNESLALLREIGANIVFYPIDENNHPATDQLPTVTTANRPDLFLLVHYFGDPTPYVDALAFCRSHGAWLVEDAAHVLRPIPGVGEAGDFVLYSPHKHLAIPDGAILVIRDNGPAALTTRTDDLMVLETLIKKIFSGRRNSEWVSAVWVVKRTLQKFGFRARNRCAPLASDNYVTPEVYYYPKMSILAKRLLFREISGLSEHVAHRKQSAQQWAIAIGSMFPRSLCELAIVCHTPYLACVKLRDQASAMSLYAKLQSLGVPVSSWPDLPPEIAGVAYHAVANRLRNTRLYLPVHRSVKPREIRAFENRLRNVHSSGWRLRRTDSKKEWEDLWLGCKRKSLSQTWEYGSAKALAEGWRVNRFVVFDDTQSPTALFQVLFKGLPGIGGISRINRGPIMLGDESDTDESRAIQAIAALARESRRHGWWITHIAPLLPPKVEVEQALRTSGFRKLPICPMDSAIIDLSRNETELLMGFNGKWRNCLRKGQRLGVNIKFDDGGREHLQLLLRYYRAQQREKQFDGTSDQMIRALAANHGTSFKFNLFLATDVNDVDRSSILGLLVTIHFADVSEYLIGVTNEMGRAKQVNSVLLWEAILHAKRNGCRWLDVGGLNERTPKGIAAFKQGLNPEPYSIVGEWVRWF
jgi:dTDP-4-amino-4,6-dideoxygalactose transaminase